MTHPFLHPMTSSETFDLPSQAELWPQRPGVPQLRDQLSIWEDVPGPVLSCPPEEDKCRQEFKQEADLLYQLARFGVGQVPRYGHQDMDLDLTTALNTMAAAKDAWHKVPEALRARYRDWAALETAERSGELQAFLKASEASAAGAEGSGASTSDSASV